MSSKGKKTWIRVAVIALILTIISGVGYLFATGMLYEKENMLANKYFKEGMLHYNMRQYTAAIEHFQKSLVEDADFQKARLWLAKSYYYAGYIDNAFTEWKRVEQLGHMDPVFKLKLDNIMFKRSIDSSYEIPGPFVYQTSFSIKPPNTTIYTSFPKAVYSNEENQIFFVDYNLGSVWVYNSNGIMETSFSGAEIGFGNIYDMTFDSKQGIFVTDYSQNKVHKIDLANNRYLSFSGSGSDNGLLYGPRGISTDKNDHIYVCDSGNNRIVKFDNDSNFLANIPPNWETNDRFGTITSIACHDDLIYVCDLENHCLWVFNLDGIYQDKIEDPEWVEPLMVKIAEDKNALLLTDQISGVYLMNLKNREIQKIFTPDQQVKAPLDAEVDHNGELILLDSVSRQVYLYLPEKLKYSNIIVDIEQSYFSGFPNVTHKVRVRTKTGVHIRGITGYNFQVFEDKYPIRDVTVREFQPVSNKIALSFVKDTNPYMETHADRIEKFARQFFENLHSLDMVQVVDGNSASLLQDFTTGRLNSLYTLMEFEKSPLERLQEEDVNKVEAFQGYDMREGFGQALYYAIGNVNKKDNYKQAVVILTEGNMKDINFTPVGIDECIHFAKANYVPIYVISFTEGPATNMLKRLAEETGGEYYLERTDGNLAKLAETIRDKQEDLYLVSYYTFAGDKRVKPYREVEILVQTNEMIGLDKTEYFLP